MTTLTGATGNDEETDKMENSDKLTCDCEGAAAGGRSTSGMGEEPVAAEAQPVLDAQALLDALATGRDANPDYRLLDRPAPPVLQVQPDLIRHILSGENEREGEAERYHNALEEPVAGPSHAGPLHCDQGVEVPPQASTSQLQANTSQLQAIDFIENEAAALQEELFELSQEDSEELAAFAVACVLPPICMPQIVNLYPAGLRVTEPTPITINNLPEISTEGGIMEPDLLELGILAAPAPAVSTGSSVGVDLIQELFGPEAATNILATASGSDSCEYAPSAEAGPSSGRARTTPQKQKVLRPRRDPIAIALEEAAISFQELDREDAANAQALQEACRPMESEQNNGAVCDASASVDTERVVTSGAMLVADVPPSPAVVVSGAAVVVPAAMVDSIASGFDPAVSSTAIVTTPSATAPASASDTTSPSPSANAPAPAATATAATATSPRRRKPSQSVRSKPVKKPRGSTETTSTSRVLRSQKKSI